MGKFEIKKLAVIFAIFLTIFHSCKEDDESSALISINPLQSELTGAIMNNRFFTINVQSDVKISKLQIQSQDDYFGTETLLDSTLNLFNFNIEYLYEIKNYPDTTEVFLNFKLLTENGNEYHYMRRLKVYSQNNYLIETSGHVIYSSLSNNENGFNLTELKPFYTQALNETIHFADNSIDTIYLNTLSRKWYSPDNFYFVRFENFNYPQATEITVQQAYEISTKHEFVQNIQDSDIIMVGDSENALAVIYISQVVDPDSTLNDKYVFNVKKMPSLN